MKPFLILLSGIAITLEAAAVQESKPNILIFVADDLGYGDLGCFGNTTIRTPHIDKLAWEGVRLTHNLAAESVCTPSRAALLTGRYPIRSGMAAAHFMRVFVVTACSGGLPANETTVAEIAKAAGYSTALLGKWHQGWSADRSDPDHHHPLNQGFDYFYGVPTSNFPDFEDGGVNMFNIKLPHLRYQLMSAVTVVTVTVACLVRARYVSLRLGLFIVLVTATAIGYLLSSIFLTKLHSSIFFRNYDVAEQPIHLPSVTNKLVLESQHFLQARHADHAPFLLIVSWLHVHTALVTAPHFRGRSRHGRYGDAVEEMDWGVGQVLHWLESLGFANNTLVYFTSDHGGDTTETDWTGQPAGGFNGPFRGAKVDSSTEGAIRVPGIVRWPGKVPAGGVLEEPVSLMDVLPTLASLLRVAPPSGLTLDGRDLTPLLTGQTSMSPHRFLFHYCGDKVHAVRYRPRTGTTVWKLLLRGQINSAGCGSSPVLDPPHLIDLTSDPGETTPLDVELHREVVVAMLSAREEHERSVQQVPYQLSLGSLLWRPWNQVQLCCNFPRCSCQDDKYRGMFDGW